MAKKAAKSVKAPEPDSEERVTVFNLKGTREYRSWLDRLADHCRMPTSTLSDVAIADYAKRAGFAEQPPKRLTR